MAPRVVDRVLQTMPQALPEGGLQCVVVHHCVRVRVADDTVVAHTRSRIEGGGRLREAGSSWSSSCGGHWDASGANAWIVELIPLVGSNQMLSGFTNIPDLDRGGIVYFVLHCQGVHADKCRLNVLVPDVVNRSRCRCT